MSSMAGDMHGRALSQAVIVSKGVVVFTKIVDGIYCTSESEGQ